MNLVQVLLLSLDTNGNAPTQAQQIQFSPYTQLIAQL